MTEQHSILHGIKAAKCNTPWESMPGEGVVRSCPNCKKTVIEASHLAEAEVVTLIHDAEPDRPINEIRLYRRADGRLMTSPSKCSVASFGEIYFSWPVVLVLAAGYFALTLLTEHDQQAHTLVTFARDAAFNSCILIGLVASRCKLNVPLKRLGSLQFLIGSISTFAWVIYAVMRFFNIPVLTVDNSMMVNILIGTVIVGGAILVVAPSQISASKARKAIESREADSDLIP